jgi:hypothetical protein
MRQLERKLSSEQEQQHADEAGKVITALELLNNAVVSCVDWRIESV